MRRSVLRRFSTLVAAALIVGLTFGAGLSSAAPAGTKLTREKVAEKLLARQGGRLFTSTARLALQSIVHGAAHEPAEHSRDLAPGQIKQASGGLSAPTGGLTNVRVNDPSLDTHQPDQTTQSETAVAVAGSNVVVGYNDSQLTLQPFLLASANLTGFSYSSNGGTSFTDGGGLPLTPEFINFGDPWLATDRNGTFYFSQLQFDYFNFNLDIGVAKSSNGGQTWSQPQPITRPTFDVLYSGDKDAMAVGPDPSLKTRDNVYVAWDDFSIDFSTCTDVSCPVLYGLPVARSIDGGATWQVTYADRFASDIDTGCSFQQYIGALPIVDPKSGDVFVAAERFAVNDPTCEGGSFTTDISIFRSTDGGQTFGPRVKIADVTPSFPNGVLKLAPSQYIRNLELPTAAFLNNALYVAWNDGTSGNSHVRLAKSTNAGSSWSLSWATQGSNDEFQPALSGDNQLHLLYYSRNSNNTLDTIVANSSNGSGFVARRVTSQSFPGVSTFPQFDPIIAFTYMGDYIANVSDGSHQYFAWGDNRDKVTNFLWPNGRNDPNVYFARQ